MSQRTARVEGTAEKMVKQFAVIPIGGVIGGALGYGIDAALGQAGWWVVLAAAGAIAAVILEGIRQGEI